MSIMQTLNDVMGGPVQDRKAKLTLMVLLMAELNLVRHLITEQTWNTVVMAILAAYLVANVTESKKTNAAPGGAAAADPLPAPVAPVQP